jgi:hypothetical protein
LTVTLQMSCASQGAGESCRSIFAKREDPNGEQRPDSESSMVRLYEAPSGLVGMKVILRFENYDRIEVFLDEKVKGILAGSGSGSKQPHQARWHGPGLCRRLPVEPCLNSWAQRQVATMDSLRHHFGFRHDPFPQNVPVKDLFPSAGVGTTVTAGVLSPWTRKPLPSSPEMWDQENQHPCAMSPANAIQE